MHTCRPQGATLRKVLFLPFCPSFSWLGKKDSGANKVSVGVCEAYVEIPEISKIDISYIIRNKPARDWRVSIVIPGRKLLRHILPDRRLTGTFQPLHPESRY